MRCFQTLLVAAFVVIGVAPSWAAREEIPVSIVAIVDVQRLLQESLAARGVKEQIEAQSSKFQNQISQEEKELRETEAKLAKLRETAQADDYAQAEQKLRERFLFVERHVQARRKALDQAYTEAMNKVREGLVEIVKNAAKARGINLVIVKQQVIWNDQVIDLTDIVLKKLNETLPKIDVKISSEEEKTQNPKKTEPSE